MRAALEWPATLDVRALPAAEWRPTQFALKMHARCDLACDYCYVHRMADRGWRARPAVTSPATVRRTPWGIAEHADTHGLTSLRVDSPRSAYPGAAGYGLNVAPNAFDAAPRRPAIAARQLDKAALGKGGGPCAGRDVCGGGLYAHRHRAGSGFHNPTVHCPDLFALIHHVSARVRAGQSRGRDGAPW